MGSVRRSPARRNARDARTWIRLARRGEFARAWKVSDRIRQRTIVFADASIPRHRQQVWDGRPLDGRHVLVRCYHGLGDTIQWARYLPMLCARARSVTVWAQPALIPILRSIEGDVTFVALDDGPGEPDREVDIEITELPYAFRTTLQTIPAAVPYLRVPAAPGGDDCRLPKVGIVWRGGDWDTRRWVPFNLLLPLLEREGVAWYDLQLESCQGEHHPNLTRVDCSTILKTAVWLQRLDLLLAVDSMVAHLAGALGVPTWTLLRRDADWRWMEHRRHSPWYPTMRLFRQPYEGAWPRVIDDVGRALDLEFDPTVTRRAWRTVTATQMW
jgi:hypothetical protein